MVNAERRAFQRRMRCRRRRPRIWRRHRHWLRELAALDTDTRRNRRLVVGVFGGVLALLFLLMWIAGSIR